MRTPSLVSAAGTLLLAVALASCGTRASEEPCPGQIQGTFRLRGILVDGAACADAGGADAALDVGVSISFVGDAGAAVCLQRPLAAPLLGTRSGDAIQVATPARTGRSRGCACSVDVVEEITGELVRAAGTAAAFAGELTTSFSAADGTATCAAADATATCDVPCRVRWTLTSG